MRRNNVRGPTSALTEYLKASGIRARHINRRGSNLNRGQNEQNGDGDAPDAGPSNSREAGDEAEDGEAGEEPSATRTNATRRRASGYNSDELDASEDDEEPEKTGTKRKGSKPAVAQQKAKEKEKAKAKKKAKKGDDEDEDGEEEDVYHALSKSLWSGSGSSKPPVGSFENCAKCEKQFTVTKYTMAANPGPGFLCHPCAKASGTDPFKKPAAPRKKRPTEKRAVVSFEERKFPTLASMCIDLITKHIDDVEALGDIGTLNAQAISKALSRNRKLTSEHATLFYHVSNTSLTFHDTTDLAPAALSTLARLNPNLTHLHLDYCGQLNNAAFDTFTNSLPHLTHLILLGPFLVHTENWQRFFSTRPSLESFQITQSPRFDLACIKALVRHCGASLTELRLKQVGKLDDACLNELAKLGEWQKLRMLDLSEPSASCSDEAMIELMGAIGRGLRVLNLSKHNLLTDTFLEDGLGRHVSQLERLSLNHIPELTDDGVESFFTDWANPPLVEIDLSRNHELGSKALPSLLKHSGKTLEILNINSWKEVSEDALNEIAGYGRELRKLDVGWCRQVDNFVVKAWLDGNPDHEGWTGCPKLTELKIWGCNRITAACPRKKGLSIYGVESQEVII